MFLSWRNLNQMQWSIDPELEMLSSLVCQMFWMHLFSFDMHIHLVLSVKQEEASVTQIRRVGADGRKVIKTILVKTPNKWITKVNGVIIVYFIAYYLLVSLHYCFGKLISILILIFLNTYGEDLANNEENNRHFSPCHVIKGEKSELC